MYHQEKINQPTPSDMTTAEEILHKVEKQEQDKYPPVHWYTIAIKAMEEYAQLKLSEHSTKEQEEILSTLKEAEEQLRWLYNNAEFEGGMPVRSCIDKVNEVIKKYSTPVKK